MDLKDIDILEIVDRYYTLMKQYTDLSIELSKKMENFGRIRNELQIIIDELSNRGKIVEDSKELLEKIENRMREIENGKEANSI